MTGIMTKLVEAARTQEGTEASKIREFEFQEKVRIQRLQNRIRMLEVEMKAERDLGKFAQLAKLLRELKALPQ